MIKATIFDLNGIFIKSRKLGDRFEKDFNVPPSVFLPKLFEIMGKIRKHNAGSAFSYWEPCLNKGRPTGSGGRPPRPVAGVGGVADHRYLEKKKLKEKG